jgi:hypothetical protein
VDRPAALAPLDIWVGHTQVADPSYYRPACMALWDEALAGPMTELGGQRAGDVEKKVEKGRLTRDTRDKRV